jgi:E3 ubiquitin-protein ligase DOA10
VKEIRYKESMEVDNGKKDCAEEEFEEYEEVEAIMNMDEETVPEEDVKRCRFCWQTQADPSNPLFTSCKCSGSVGFIHFNCLRSWLDIKKQMKIQSNFSSYYWKAFECEICKKAYPRNHL